MSEVITYVGIDAQKKNLFMRLVQNDALDAGQEIVGPWRSLSRAARVE